jgi:hypothetical protein
MKSFREKIYCGGDITLNATYFSNIVIRTGSNPSPLHGARYLKRQHSFYMLSP